MMIATASAMPLQREPRRPVTAIRATHWPPKMLASTSRKPMHRAFQHLARPPIAQIQAHEHRNGHGGGDRECSPGAAFERVDDHQRNHGQQDHHDQQHGDQRHEPTDLADLFARHLAKRFAVAPHGPNRMTKSCTAPPSTAPIDDPQVPGQIAELRGKRRTHQRTGPGDGGEMMAEQNPFVGGFEVVPVAQPLGRRGAPVVERHDFARR